MNIPSSPTQEEYKNVIYKAFTDKIKEMGADNHVFSFTNEELDKIFAFYFWAICIADVNDLLMLDLHEVIPSVKEGIDGYDTESDLKFHFLMSIPDWMENPYR